MSDLQVSKINDVYCRVDGDISALRELVDYFTFRVPGCEFMPAYKAKMWDGNIKLYDPNKRTLYMGLVPYIDKFARGEWTVEYEDDVFAYGKKSDETIKEMCEVINPHSHGEQIEHRDYQLDGIGVAMNKKRSLLLSPTGSGKSLIIYTLIRYYEHVLNNDGNGKKILIIVPTTSLVKQMFSDFDDYSSEDIHWNADEKCHIVFQGQDKIDYEKPIVISTWQSIYKMQKPYFKNYGAVIGDECHLFKANSLMKIMEKLEECPYRVGTTGTLDGTKTHQLVLEGLFGEVHRVTTTKKLMDDNKLTELKINCLVLKHEEMIAKELKGMVYKDEINWIVSNEKRNTFIKNLVKGLKGNSLVLFNMVEKHGRPLYEMINDDVGDERPVFFIHGGVSSDYREQIRHETETHDDAIIVASYGTFSTGINIRNLHNIIFASPYKSKIKVLQSIGRVLRKSKTKVQAILYDIVDDLSHKKHKNFALKHFIERIKLYNDEKFNYKVFEIPIKDK